MKKLFWVFMISLCLTGCTIPYHLFVKNYSNEALSLSFKLAPHIKLARHEIFRWDSVPAKIRNRHFAYFKEKHVAYLDSDSVFHYLIPANATVYLNAGLRNVRELKFNGQHMDSLGLKLWGSGYPPKVFVNWRGKDNPDIKSATHQK